MEANIVRRSPTHGDSLGLFVLVRGSRSTQADCPRLLELAWHAEGQDFESLAPRRATSQVHLGRHPRRGKHRRRAATAPVHPMTQAQQGQIHLLAMHRHPRRRSTAALPPLDAAPAPAVTENGSVTVIKREVFGRRTVRPW